MTHLNTSGITSIHIEPGKPEDGLWLDAGGVDALLKALLRG